MGEIRLTREQMLLAQYLLLAVCHDFHLFGERLPIITQEFANADKEVALYQAYRSDAPGRMILDANEQHLEPALKDVQHDLKEQGLAPVKVNLEKQPLADQPAAQQGALYEAPKDELIPVKTAADLLGVTSGRVTQLCDDEKKLVFQGTGKARQISKLSVLLYKAEKESGKLKRRIDTVGRDGIRDAKELAADEQRMKKQH